MKVNIHGKVLWINFHHLYYFYIVVNEGNLARASKILSIGQPTLSSQIRQFEQSLEVSLFDRSARKLVLTEAGKLAHQYATEIFKIGTEMATKLTCKQQEMTNNLKIGLMDGVPKCLGLDICKNAMLKSQKNIQIIKGRSDELFKDFEDHEIDLLITNFVPENSEKAGFSFKKISSSPIIICGHKKFQTLQKSFPRSLEDAPLMLPLKLSKSRQDIDNYFEKMNIKIKVLGETNDISMQKLFASEGMGLIATSLASVEDLLENNNLIEIGRLNGVTEDIYLLCSENNVIVF